MSHRATLYVKDLRVCPNGEPVTQREKLVLYALADYHQDKLNRDTYPSVATLAEESMMDVRSCRRVLDSIEAKGVLERQRGSQGRGHLTFYRFVELDGEMVPARPKSASGIRQQKGGATPSFVGKPVEVQKEGKKGAERGQNRCPLIEEQEHEQKQTPPPAPSPAARGPAAELETPPAVPPEPGLLPEQLDHLARCKARGEDTRKWEDYYREENRRHAAVMAEAVRLRNEFPDCEAAARVVMKACAFVLGPKPHRNPLPNVLIEVLQSQEIAGQPPWVTGPRMIAAWRGREGGVDRGPVKFYREGHWVRFAEGVR